jgi:hypothetical protein
LWGGRAVGDIAVLREESISLFGAVAGFVSGASSMRVREIALRWGIPPTGPRYLGFDADVTLAGRNLAT